MAGTWDGVRATGKRALAANDPIVGDPEASSIAKASCPIGGASSARTSDSGTVANQASRSPTP